MFPMTDTRFLVTMVLQGQKQSQAEVYRFPVNTPAEAHAYARMWYPGATVLKVELELE